MRGEERRQQRIVGDKSLSGSETYFWLYFCSLALVTSFHYMGWILMATDDDWPEVVGNLQKAR